MDSGNEDDKLLNQLFKDEENMPAGRWLGHVPGFCEVCDGPIHTVFYDAPTNQGPWAIMCPKCFTVHSVEGKLGTGRGQQYTLDKTTGLWPKTGG